MVNQLDLVLGCHEYQHVDMGERGREAVDLLTTLRVVSFPKQRKPGPLWPMDLGARWEAELA